MNRLLTALSVASLVVACTTTPEKVPQASAEIIEEGPPPPKNVERPGFTVQVPRGWEEITSEAAKKVTGDAGAAIAKPEIMAVPAYNSANIVIRPVTRMDTDPKDPEACQKTAEALARVQQSTIDAATLVTLPSTGETCQVALSGLEESPGSTNRKTKVTILAAPNNNYVLSCYYDGRDTSAATACDDTLTSFTFKAVAAPAEETTPAESGTETTGEGAGDAGSSDTEGSSGAGGTSAPAGTGTGSTGSGATSGATGTGTSPGGQQ